MKELISETKIRNRVREIAYKITSDYKGRTPIFVGILNGSFIFLADLIRELDINSEVDFMKLSSYDRDESTGTVNLIKDISSEIEGRDVIIVEDIIDSGLTINFIIDHLNSSLASSVSVATLLFKKEVAQLNFKPEYIGFEIPSGYVVGYGLDYCDRMRNLKAIHVLDKLDTRI